MARDPHDDWLATEFLKRLRADEASAARRLLADYLAEHPGREELIAREFVLATEADVDDEAGGAADAPTASDRVGPFRLLRELGRGSQGAVHLAEDLRLRREVALRLRRGGEDAMQTGFLREAYAAARLQHPPSPPCSRPASRTARRGSRCSTCPVRRCSSGCAKSVGSRRARRRRSSARSRMRCTRRTRRASCTATSSRRTSCSGWAGRCCSTSASRTTGAARSRP